MRIGVGTNQAARGRAATTDELIEQVATYARHGFDKVVFAQLQGPDVLTVIALAGRVVPDIEFETAGVPVYPRHPGAPAQQALTTQAANRGWRPPRLGRSRPPGTV